MSLKEVEWQQQVIDAAHLFGWAHLHVRRSIGRHGHWVTSTNRIGWCDLFLWHPKHGFAAIELKVKPNKATAEQLEVLAELATAGAVTMVAYPEDWDQVETILRGRPLAVAS